MEKTEEIPQGTGKNTLTGLFWAVSERNFDGEYTFRLLNWDPTGLPNYVLLRPEPYSVTVEVPPEFNPRAAELESLRHTLQKAREDHTARTTAGLEEVRVIETKIAEIEKASQIEQALRSEE